MPIRNNHWYDLNDQRKYPIADTASCIADDGKRLPSALLADLRLRWPLTCGRYGFLASYAITPQLVTVLFAATPSLDDPEAPVSLIAGYTGLRKDTTPGRAFPLQSFQPGSGGFVVFGNLPDDVCSGKFAAPGNSVLAPRAARGVRTPPVRTIGVDGSATNLTRLVQLAAESPLSVTRETREIGGVLQTDVVVFRLQGLEQTSQLATQPQDVLAAFAGSCGARVGTNSCGDPAPILSFNGVTPDCDGVITLDFRNCALVGRNSTDCGAILDCEMSLSDVCDPPYLPDLTTGELPNEIITDVVIPPTPPPPPPPDPPTVSVSVHDIIGIDLPYCESFDEMTTSGTMPTFFTAIGESFFEYVTDDSPAAGYCNDIVSSSSSVPISSSASVPVSSSSAPPPVSSSSAPPPVSSSASVPVSSSSPPPDFCTVIPVIPNLFRWYNAAVGVTLSTSPDRVASWRDQSPNAFLLPGLPLELYRPYYALPASSDAIAGRPTLGFDMIRWLAATATAPLGGANGFTIASVFRYRQTRLAPNVPNTQGAIWALAGFRAVLGVHESGSSWFLRLSYRKADADAVSYVDGPVLNHGDVVLAIGRVSYVAGSEFATLEVNGVTYTGTPPTAGVIASTNKTEFTAYANTFVFANEVDNKRAMPSDTAEIVVYSRALSSPETDAVRDCLVSRYALTPALTYSFPSTVEWQLVSVEAYDPAHPVADAVFVTASSSTIPTKLRFKRRSTSVEVPDHLDLENNFFTQAPFLSVTLVKTHEGYDTWDSNWISGSTSTTWGVAYSASYTSISGGSPLGIGSEISASSSDTVGESKTVTWTVHIYRSPQSTGWVVRSRCDVNELHDLSLTPNRQLHLYATKHISSATIFDDPGLLSLDAPRESSNPAEVGISADATSDEFPGEFFDGRNVVALLQWY